MDETIEFFKQARRMGLDISKFIDTMTEEQDTTGVEVTTATLKETIIEIDPGFVAAEKAVEHKVLRGVELGLSYDEAVAMACGLRLGREYTTFDLTLKLLGPVPEDAGDRRACTNSFMRLVDDLEPVRTSRGTVAKRMTPWAQSPAFKPLTRLADGSVM